MKKKRKQIFCLGIVIIMLLSCGGCSGAIVLQSGREDCVLKIGSSRVDMSELKTILLEYKDAYNRHDADIDSAAIWKETDESGATYEEYLLYNYVLDEIVTLEILQMLAQEGGISLTEEEEKQASKGAEAYIERLNEATKAYCYATLENAEHLMKKYALAQKTIEVLTAGKNQEVSENEARAITIQIMEFSEAAQAQEVWEQLLQESSFYQIYTDIFGESPKDCTITRGTLLPVLEEKAYELKSGETTGILEYQDEKSGKIYYFILYCVNDYISELTKTNMEIIRNRKMTEYWMPRVEEKRDELSLYLEENRLKKENLEYADELEAQFYDTYHEYFEEYAEIEEDTD